MSKFNRVLISLMLVAVVAFGGLFAINYANENLKQPATDYEIILVELNNEIQRLEELLENKEILVESIETEIEEITEELNTFKESFLEVEKENIAVIGTSVNNFLEDFIELVNNYSNLENQNYEDLMLEIKFAYIKHMYDVQTHSGSINDLMNDMFSRWFVGNKFNDIHAEMFFTNIQQLDFLVSTEFQNNGSEFLFQIWFTEIYLTGQRLALYKNL